MIPVDFNHAGKLQYSIIKKDGVSRKEIGQYETRTLAFRALDRIKEEEMSKLTTIKVIEELLFVHFKNIVTKGEYTYQIVENYD